MFVPAPILLLLAGGEVGSKLIVIHSLLIVGRLGLMYYNVKPVFFLILYIGSFVTPYFSYFFRGYQISMWDSFNSLNYVTEALKILYIFLISLLLFSAKRIRNYIPMMKRVDYVSSGTVFYILCFTAFILIVFGLNGESLLSGRNYSNIQYNRSALFEYSLIFILLAILFSGLKSTRVSLVLILGLIMLVKDFIYGGRIASVMLVLIFFSVLYDGRIKESIILTILFISFVALEFIGYLRSNTVEVVRHGIQWSDFISTLFSGQGPKVIISTQGDLAHSTARIMGMIDNGVLSISDRIGSLFYNIVSILLPGKELELANLSAYKQETYGSGGGVLLPASFYAWFSYPGVIFSGYLVSRIMEKYITTTSRYWSVYLILALSTFPRWFSYSTIVLFKLCIYGVVIFTIIHIFKRNKKFENSH